MLGTTTIGNRIQAHLGVGMIKIAKEVMENLR
jgi:hypothetical protein